MACDLVAVEGGVGGDESLEAAIEKDAGEIGCLLVGQVGGDFEKDRDVFPVLCG